jgi:hypothetical protein
MGADQSKDISVGVGEGNWKKPNCNHSSQGQSFLIIKKKMIFLRKNKSNGRSLMIRRSVYSKQMSLALSPTMPLTVETIHNTTL